MTGPAGKCQRALPAPAGSATASGAVFEITFQPSGAVTVNSNAALRSGWSKQA